VSKCQRFCVRVLPTAYDDLRAPRVPVGVGQGMCANWFPACAPPACAPGTGAAFEDLRLHRVQISIIPRNQASRRVAEKLELRNEGLAERYLEINGVWEDHFRFAITAEEWAERRDELVTGWLL
jgi:hypothetical protein